MVHAVIPLIVLHPGAASVQVIVPKMVKREQADKADGKTRVQ